MGIYGLSVFLKGKNVFEGTRFVQQQGSVDRISNDDASLERLTEKLTLSSDFISGTPFHGKEPLVVDAYAFTHLVSAKLPPNYTEIDHSARLIRDLKKCIKLWRIFGLEPIFVWDGSHSSGKSATLRERRDDKVSEALKTNSSLKDVMEKKSTTYLPQFCGVGHRCSQIIKELDETNVTSFRCVGEADSVVVALGMVLNAYTTSNDSDVLLMSCLGKGMIPVDSWSFFSSNLDTFSDEQIYLTCVVGRPKKIQSAIKLRNLKALPLFASLCKNDYISGDMLQQIGMHQEFHFQAAARVAEDSLNATNPFEFPPRIISEGKTYTIPPDLYTIFNTSLSNYLPKLDAGIYDTVLGKIVDHIVAKSKVCKRWLLNSETTALNSSESVATDEDDSIEDYRMTFGILNEDVKRPTVYFALDHIILLSFFLNHMGEAHLHLSIAYRVGENFDTQPVHCAAARDWIRKLFEALFGAECWTSRTSTKKDSLPVDSVSNDDKIRFVAEYFSFKDIILAKIVNLPLNLRLYALILSACPALWTISNFDIFYVLAATFIKEKAADALLSRFQKRDGKAHKYLWKARHDIATLVKVGNVAENIAEVLEIPIISRNLNCVGVFLTEVQLGNELPITNFIYKHVPSDVADALRELSCLLKECGVPFLRRRVTTNSTLA